MEKREPSLAPEWLKSSSGHASGGGSSNQLLSSSRSDSNISSNRNPRSKSDVDSVRSPFFDRSSSTNTRRGPSNGYTQHAYSSFNFNRSQRDRDWSSREKDRGLSYLDPWDHDTSFPLGNFLTGRDQEPLRRSHSMVTRKLGNPLTQGHPMGLKNGGSMNLYKGNVILPRTSPVTSPVRSSNRTGFEKNFPSLGGEERNGVPDIVRISSPSLSPTVQGLSVGNSALIVGEGWTSALAEVPNVIEKSGSGSHANVGSSATLNGPSSRNMAEALAQAPTRTGTPTQGSVQRFEDRAIKQSRQLIPVVPSGPKVSVLNSDKSKIKPGVRSCETGLAFLKSTQQQSSLLLSSIQPNPGSQIKTDTNKKLVVLKPARENGVGAGCSPPNSRATANQMTTAPSSQITPSVRSTNGPREFKGAASVQTIAGKTAEKKLSLAQTQSRNAFYSALKQKPSSNISTDPSKTESCVSSALEEKANRSMELVANDPSSAHAVERDENLERVEKVSEVTERISVFELADRPDEKEAEFLKSLGWDENYTEEDKALTEEEIRDFIERCKKVNPLLVPKLSIMQEITENISPKS